MIMTAAALDEEQRRGPAACAQGQPMPLHRLSRRSTTRSAGMTDNRGGRRRQGLRRQPPEPVRPKASSPAGRATPWTWRSRGCCTSRCCARRTPMPASSPIGRDKAHGGAGRGRGLHLGGRAAPALQHRDRTRTIWSIRTTPTCSTTSCASSASGSPPSSPRPRPPRRRACRLLDVELRDPAGGVRPGRGHGAGRADPARQGRRGEGQHLRRHPRRGRQRGGRLQGRRRRARDDLFDLARPARASGDARLDRLARRRRPDACPHQLAGAVHRAAEALPHLRPAAPRPACLHRARRRRLRRQAGDDLRGSLRARHAARPAGR